MWRSSCMAMVGLLAFIGTAEAQSVNFNVFLSGDEEVPPVVTETSGQALLHTDARQTVIDFSLRIDDGDGILGVSGAHLHCAPAGENGPVVAFLAGPASPGFDGDVKIEGTLTDSSIININTACGGTISELTQEMLFGNVYVNVHSAEHPGGEVRGQVQ